MSRLSALGAACLIVVSTWTAGCSSSSSSSSSSVTGPSATPTTEVFTGTVPVGGSDSHNFTVALSNGQLNVILTQAGPPSTIYMGLGVGNPGTSGCTLLSGGSTATPGGATAQLSGTVNAGSYCVSVFDIGNQTVDVTYSVTVTHY
jgi:hypothetical protein